MTKIVSLSYLAELRAIFYVKLILVMDRELYPYFYAQLLDNERNQSINSKLSY